MKTKLVAALFLLVGLMMVPFQLSAQTSGDDNVRILLDLGASLAEAQLTLYKMGNHQTYAKQVKNALRGAKGVLIVPELIKGGLIIGGQGGKGLIMVRRPNGEWSYPAFYTIAGGSIGLQVGIQTSELMVVVASNKGLAALLEDKFTIGGSLNVAALTTGVGIGADTTRNLGVDLYSFALSSGLYLGADIDGTVLIPDDKLNSIFYGTNAANPTSILINGEFSNPSADALRAAMMQLIQTSSQ